MIEDLVLISTRILVALTIGAVIGFERGFHGRPAGFRTHALVCLASSLLMLVTVFQNNWMTQVPAEAIRTDPTRMAQGIMTGIGFLGAGVIFKEGVSVKGLTTAASIWITSAIGILIGIGFYVPAVIGAVATLVVLSGLRSLEARLPRTFHAHYAVKFKRESVVSEPTMRELLERHGFTALNFAHKLTDNGQNFEYRTTIRGARRRNTDALSADLRRLPEVIDFRITTAGE